jgi:hypothetical protein
MQELFRYQRENKLNEIQKLWMASSRPPVEFYDVINDPYQLNNLADDEKYRDEIKMMAESLDEWRLKTKDLGDYSESELQNIWWKNGEQPITNKPIIIPNTKDNPGLRHEDSGFINLAAPALVELHCSTQGSTIIFTTDECDNADWKIYSGPIKLYEGSNLIRAIACRYGYKESEESRFKIVVE